MDNCINIKKHDRTQIEQQQAARLPPILEEEIRMDEHQMLESVIDEYQEELHRVYQILKKWDTPPARSLALEISASLPWRGEKAIRRELIKLEGKAIELEDKVTELKEENQRLRSLKDT